ncbi:patatin-like phospholipase family protein [Cytobacillus sp. IB215665]|uniref:patatin-like phospholipase family protein n=1 Tax=Cytobacillus sp. IB215665 TaxID=3097357 RepID=UPI002A0D656B|nr:patatin-like phospholipase family protein [Cytobacillus sp. IB215665]MDX8364269.1 patatin-like phospholipase family protein [Cytobacillus sp. IB215665]
MYIDGVFSGGGIKGFSLIGAYEAIEEKGLHFTRVAGTSAGAIIAAFIASGYSSKEILSIMEEVDVKTFLDARKSILPAAIGKWIQLYWRMGLYKGDELEKWVGRELRKKGVRTFRDLPNGSLRFVASDLTNGKMLVLPNDLPKYGMNPDSFSVAKAVRMSASLPYFFEPVKLLVKGKPVIVDGGVLSNFPIFLFDEEKKLKKRPVLGIKLSAKESEQQNNKINNAIELFPALFETMKVAHDERHISRRHERNIIFIPMNHTVTTEFSISDEKKQELVKLGYDQTSSFLKKWSY